MSMDGKNRTVIINLDRRRYYADTILSLTLDYQAQMLYWIFSHRHNYSLVIESSNVNGTNRRTILLLTNNAVNYHDSLRFPPRLTIYYNDTFFLSSPWSDEIYKLLTSGDNVMTVINSLVFCGDNYYHLKVTKQLPGELHALSIYLHRLYKIIMTLLLYIIILHACMQFLIPVLPLMEDAVTSVY